MSLVYWISLCTKGYFNRNYLRYPMNTKKLLISSLFVFCFITIGLQAQVTVNQVDSFLREQINEYHIPALSVAIIDNGKTVMMKSYGTANLEYGIPNSDSTAFQLASATKLVSATAVMLLVQEGKLDLNQKVSHYLPSIPASWDDMKVIDLLAHQSGIADLLGMKYHFNSVNEALDTAMVKPLDFKPGTKTVYAGGDYAVIMKVVEEVSGMEFQEFLRQRLLDKLGMQHTAFNNMEQDYIYRTADLMPYAAPVYQWDEKSGKQRIFSMMFPKWTYPSGGLFASIQDLAKWVIALDAHTILKPETTETMWTAATLRNGENSNFGVGWIVAEHHGEKATGHSGGPALADIVRIPGRKITAIVLTNQVNLRPFLTMKVLDLYLADKGPQ